MINTILPSTRKWFAKMTPQPLVEKRDEEILTRLARILKPSDRVLDVGCGNGRLSVKIMEKTGAKLEGTDVQLFADAAIAVTQFNGEKLPFPDHSFDGVIIVDVLHHVETARELLKECLRVSKKYVVIKDHYYENSRQLQRLKMADSAGNFAEGIPTPFYFWKKSEWEEWRAPLDSTAEYWKSTVIPPFTVPQVVITIQTAAKKKAK